MLLDLPLPMCRAGNKAGDGWMKGIPDTSDWRHGKMNSNSQCDQCDCKLQLYHGPICGRQNALGPYFRHLRRLTGQAFTSNAWFGRLACFFRQTKMIVWGLRGFRGSKSLAFFTQHLGHQCVESWASRFTCVTSLSFGRACEAALLRWWWMRSSGLTVKWESSGFHWI